MLQVISKYDDVDIKVKILKSDLTDREKELLNGLFDEELDEWTLYEMKDLIINFSKYISNELLIVHEQDHEFPFEKGSESKLYVKNGKSTIIEARTVWPKFKESELK